MIKSILFIVAILTTSLNYGQSNEVDAQVDISKIKKENQRLKEQNIKLKERIDIDIRKIKMLKEEKYKLVRKNRELRHATLSERYIDSKILEKIPKNILDSLNQIFPNYFIPVKNMYAGGSPHVNDTLSHPFFIKGDFNNDKVEDFAFSLNSIYAFNYKTWGYTQLLVYFYSNKLENNENHNYQIVEQEYASGVRFNSVSELAFVKLKALKEYKFRGGSKYTPNHDEILVVSFGNDVGYIVDYIGGELKFNYLWNFM